MKIFKAKLLKDLSYISNCKLKKGEIIYINKLPNNTNWVTDPKSNHTIKLFSYEFEEL